MNALLVYCVNDNNFAGIVDASKNKQKVLTNVQITVWPHMCVKVRWNNRKNTACECHISLDGHSLCPSTECFPFGMCVVVLSIASKQFMVSGNISKLM